MQAMNGTRPVGQEVEFDATDMRDAKRKFDRLMKQDGVDSVMLRTPYRDRRKRVRNWHEIRNEMMRGRKQKQRKRNKLAKQSRRRNRKK